MSAKVACQMVALSNPKLCMGASSRLQYSAHFLRAVRAMMVAAPTLYRAALTLIAEAASSRPPSIASTGAARTIRGEALLVSSVGFFSRCDDTPL